MYGGVNIYGTERADVGDGTDAEMDADDIMPAMRVEEDGSISPSPSCATFQSRKTPNVSAEAAEDAPGTPVKFNGPRTFVSKRTPSCTRHGGNEEENFVSLFKMSLSQEQQRRV